MKILAALVIALTPALALAQTVPQAEQFDVATLKPQYPHRLFAMDSYGDTGVNIVNGNDLSIEGNLPARGPPSAVFALDPAGRYFYRVCESIWTKGNRGTRQDMISSVYDSRTLSLVNEISVPGRLLVDALTHNCDVSANGKYAYVYNMQPASSVIVVNLEQRKVVSTVELPGCALAFPWGDNGFSSLCGDGTVATVPLSEGGKNGMLKPSTVTHSARFFDPDSDPIFSESLVDRSNGHAFFISYSGQIYPAQLGEHPSIDKPWSLQVAAGMPQAGTGAQDLAWRPGGLNVLVWHKAKNRLYALMHPGTHWTQKKPGTEVWVLDAAAHTLIRRIQLPQPTISIAISQDDEPLLYALTSNNQVSGPARRDLHASTPRPGSRKARAGYPQVAASPRVPGF